MKKVIILTYYYPPCNMPGANRPYGWARFLHENGYFPIIITRSWNNEIKNPSDIFLNSGDELKHEKFPTHEVFYLPHKQNLRDKIYTKHKKRKYIFIRKFLTYWESIFSNFFTSTSSYKSIYYFSDKILTEDPEIRLLIATGAPYLLFRFAFLLKKKHKIKWVADYRDDWSTNEIALKSGVFNWLLKRLNRKNEKKWVGSADVHMAVSPFSVQKNTAFLNKKGYVIHNGYMLEDFEGCIDVELYKKFTITFVGTLYITQNIEIFLEAFKNFIIMRKRKCNIHLLFPGLAFDNSQEKRVTKILEGFEEFYSITERVTKNEINEIEIKSHAFLYTAHCKPGIIGSKIYEYVGLKKPVIFCPSDGDTIEQIFTETGVGHICNTSNEASIVIDKLYRNYLSGNNNITFTESQLNNWEIYSRRHQVKVLAGVLNGVDNVNQERSCNHNRHSVISL